jgi:hypothetical protein
MPAAVPPLGKLPNCPVDTGTWGLPLPTNDTAFFTATGLEEDSPYIILRWPSACADIPINATLDLMLTGKDGKSATVQIPSATWCRVRASLQAPARSICSLVTKGCTFGGPFFTAALSVFVDEAKTVAFAQLATQST